jgi:hypothetical protein
MAAVSRLYARLIWPFEEFFSTAINAAGDIAVNRKKDPRNDPSCGNTYNGAL